MIEEITVVKTKKRSAWKTLGVKIWILLIVLIGLVGFAYIGFTSLLVKPGLGFQVSGLNLNSPELCYWNDGKFTTTGIIAAVVVGIEFILLVMTPALYNKLHFVIGKKGSFVSIVVFILVFTLLMFVAGMLNKEGLFTNLPSNSPWSWKTILWETNGSTIEPTIVWWGIFIISCLGTLIIAILFIVFLIKFLFARSHDKE